MSRLRMFVWVVLLILVTGCGSLKKLSEVNEPVLAGMPGLEEGCQEADTVKSVLISKAEAILTFDNERYEVSLTLYSVKDSILYLSAVNSGYEILRAAAMKDSIKVINRLDKIVYRAPLERRFGYQYPVNFQDLQNLVARPYLCGEIQKAHDDRMDLIIFEFDTPEVKKRIHLGREGLEMKTFEFYHRLTDKFLMGERLEDAIKIYSNFMITDFEIVARGGTTTYNRDLKIKMDVNPRRYTFTELR